MQARIVIGITLIVGLVGYLAFIGYDEGRSYYMTCDEVAAQQADLVDTKLKLAGVVVDGSIRRDGDILNFELEYEGARYSVRYLGSDPVPDTFKDGAEAVVDGHLLADGTFEGKKIQAKCASKYEASYEGEGAEKAPRPTSNRKTA